MDPCQMKMQFLCTCQIPFSQLVAAPAHFPAPLVEPVGEAQPGLSLGWMERRHLRRPASSFPALGRGQGWPESRRTHAPQGNGDMCVCVCVCAKGPRAA